MKTKLILCLMALSILGCEVKPSRNESRGIVSTELLEHIYLKGWIDGMAISKGIANGTYTNIQSASNAADGLRKCFIDDEAKRLGLKP